MLNGTFTGLHSYQSTEVYKLTALGCYSLKNRGDRASLVAVPDLWNNLPTYLLILAGFLL